MMPRSVIGTFSKAYSASEELENPYYKCNVVHVEPQVLKIYARLLPDAQAVVFGEYEIMFLFTYNDTKSNTTCFLQTLKKTFSELVDINDLTHVLKAADMADIEAEAEFIPQVACCRRKKPSYIWDVDVSGMLSVTFSIDEPDAGQPELCEDKTEPDANKKCADDGQDSSCERNLNTYDKNNSVVPDSATRCWRIGTFTDISFDTMCEMEPEEIDKYVGNDDNECDELSCPTNDSGTNILF